MNYGRIIKYDVANGEGIRTSLFVSGCTNYCPGCFNQEAQDFNYGKPYTQDTENMLLDCVKQPYVAGLSILGGDPLCQNYQDMMKLIHLCNKTHNIGKNVWLWTGFVWKDVWNLVDSSEDGYIWRQRARLLEHCDVVVDGPFIEAEKDLTLAFRGSRNQRVIDVKKTLTKGKIILYKE